MKTEDNEPKEYFERSIAFVLGVLAIGIALLFLSGYLLVNANPWGTVTAIPGISFAIQGLWLMVNPYAIVYNDRFEIQQSLLYHRQFYFLDMKGLDGDKNLMIYNDDDKEPLKLFGIKASHAILFKQKLSEKITESLNNRSFKN